MKAAFTLIISLMLYANAWTCSNIPFSFCSSVLNGYNDGNTIIYGKIIDSLQNGVRLKVFAVFRGVELRDTVTIWDNEYEFCDDTLLNRAQTLGNVGDSVFLMTMKIETIRYSWEVIGDYTAPNALLASKLIVEQDTVRGLIFGGTIFDPGTIYEYPLSSFIESLSSPQICKPVGIDEIKILNEINIYPNPTADNFTIKNLPLGANVELLNLSGQVLNAFETGTKLISTAHLAAGTYLLKINYQGETGFRRIVKL